jgi:hypothetical protein
MPTWPSLVESPGDLSAFSGRVLRAQSSTASSITIGHDGIHAECRELIPDTATVDAVNSEECVTHAESSVCPAY